MDSYLAVHSRSLQGVRDINYRLVFLHYPVPHEPIIFDRKRGGLSTAGDGDYLDNQVLADRALSELRGAMEDSSAWSDSAVIAVSDHPPKNQPGDQHPILIVKLPHSSRPLAVNSEVSLVRVFDLVLGLLRGRIQTPEDVVAAVEKGG